MALLALLRMLELGILELTTDDFNPNSLALDMVLRRDFGPIDWRLMVFLFLTWRVRGLQTGFAGGKDLLDIHMKVEAAGYSGFLSTTCSVLGGLCILIFNW